jgi:hypothetical protein
VRKSEADIPEKLPALLLDTDIAAQRVWEPCQVVSAVPVRGSVLDRGRNGDPRSSLAPLTVTQRPEPTTTTPARSNMEENPITQVVAVEAFGRLSYFFFDAEGQEVDPDIDFLESAEELKAKYGLNVIFTD